MTEICTFFTFIHVRQTCFAYNFFCVHFVTTFSTDSKSAWNSAFFDTFNDFFQKTFFLGHIGTFFKLWSQMRKKRLKKSKNVFCKCVLDFNFAPIKGSVFLIFYKKSNSLYPIVHITTIMKYKLSQSMKNIWLVSLQKEYYTLQSVRCKKCSRFCGPQLGCHKPDSLWPGEQLNYSPPWKVWLVTSRLGTGKSLTFFYSVQRPNT